MENLPPLPRDDDYALFRCRVIVIGRMLNAGGRRANTGNPPSTIHEVCYAFILRMRSYYTDITWKDIEPEAEEFQADIYSAVRADPSSEETYKRTWKPLPHEPVQEPQPQGFGAPPPCVDPRDKGDCYF